MASDIFKRAIKKAKKMAGMEENRGVTLKTSSWILEQSKAFESQAERKHDVEIVSDIIRKQTYPVKSIAIEYTIEKLLKNGNYTINNMLVILNPYQNAPLCAIALFHTKKPCRVRVTVKGKTKEEKYVLGENVSHRIPILGLCPNCENTVTITIMNSNGSVRKERKIKLKTQELKGKSKGIEIVKEKSNGEYLYKYTLVYGGDDGIFPYAFDRNGDIRFCFSLVPKTYGFQPISNGRFIFLNKTVNRITATNPAATQMLEVDQMGRVLKIYNIEKGAHHDFVELEDGNLVVGSNSIEGGTFEDTVIEIDRKTGNVVNEIKIKEYLDPKYVDVPDWAHLNSIDYNKKEKTVVVSLRNLHTVVKLNFEKKELVWILGNPQFWENTNVSDYVLKPLGDMEWFFQQHAAYYIDADLDGNSETEHLIIYDNHSHKRRPVRYFDNEKKSFVRIYNIDEKSKTVSMMKSFPCEKSTIRSNGIFETKARKIMAMSGKLKSSSAKGKISEFDYNTGELLNEFAVNYGFYRAYEFKFEPKKMVAPMDCESNYVLGKIYGMKECETVDVSEAKTLPKPVLEPDYKTEDERRRKLAEIAKKNPDYPIDEEQDMARIEFYIEEDVLYVKILDHLLEKLYLVGTKHSYFRDYTGTKQERPEYFARSMNTDPVPLQDLAEDKYEIYFRHKKGLYRSGRTIEIRKKEV